MNKKKYGNYIAIGLTALAVIAASILIFFLMYKINTVRSMLSGLVGILMPFIIGGVIAYLLTPIYNWLCRNLDYYLCVKLKRKSGRKVSKGLAVLLSILLAIGVVSGLIALVVPELISSIMGLVDSVPSYLDEVGQWLDRFLVDYGFSDGGIQAAYDSFSGDFQRWLTTDLLPNLQNSMNSVLGSVYTGVIALFNALKNVIIGFIVAAYLLAEKERLSALGKKLIYSITGAKRGNETLERIRYIHKIFGGFIQGKMLASIIIGFLCFIGASLLRLPYTLLVSVVVGVTNVIPFFGPIIGAVPCGILILLADPIKCVYFVIFILALQQFDGNILGPRILGNATGVSAFGVLFAIIIFGGIFGFVGMIVGVPLYAVISSLAEEFVNERLRKKEMSLDMEDYVHLDYVEQDEQRYVKRKDPTEK